MESMTMEATQPLLSFSADLYMFSHLQPNTFVHRDSGGRFIPTCGEYSTIFGLQTVANLYKGHKSTDLLNHLDEFISNLIASIDTAVRREWFTDLAFTCRAINSAISGESDCGGMRGLLLTYENDIIYADLKESITRLKQKAESIEDTGFSMDCPEKHLGVEQWEALMKIPLRKENKGFLHHYIYSVSFAYNDMMRTTGQWDWWNKILSTNAASLLLGALPVIQINTNDLVTLRDIEKIGAILSVTEVSENTSEGYLTSTVTPSDWMKHNIRHLQIPAPDFKTIPLDMVCRGVEFIHMNLEENRNVYVHCKAGRARSALVVMCYMIRYRKYSASEAYKEVCTKRKQAGFSVDSEKFGTLMAYEEKYK